MVISSIFTIRIMIEDTRIDLTEGTKFGRTLRVNNAYTFFGDFHIFPWNAKPLNSNEDITQPYTRKNDSLSNEFGCLVRRTSNNHWFFGDPRLRRTSYFNSLLNEMEFEFGIKQDALSVCFKCGKRYLKSKKNPLQMECKECQQEIKQEELLKKLFSKPIKQSYVNWLDMDQHVEKNPYTEEFETHFRVPMLIKESLIKG